VRNFPTGGSDILRITFLEQHKSWAKRPFLKVHR
jgi:hypothetical protein